VNYMSDVPTQDAAHYMSAPTFSEIEDAANRIQQKAVITPLLENQELNQISGNRILLKAEMLQRTGSFKFRGAYNRISQFSDEDCERGVIAYSSGNHAQAVACAAALQGTRAVIVMPDDAPEIKIENTKALGAEIVFYDRKSENREEVCHALAIQRGLTLVPPSEDRRVLAGAATVGREIALQSKSLGAPIDVILLPCGGGGLTASTALALKEMSPSTQVFAVEPEDFDDTQRSIAAGKRLSNPAGRKTICDAIMTDMPGQLTFSINKELISGVLTVSDADVVNAMRLAFEHFKLVVEPGGAVALAAAMGASEMLAGKTIAVVTTGGNIDFQQFSSLVRNFRN